MCDITRNIIATRRIEKFYYKPKGSRAKDKVRSSIRFDKFDDGAVRVMIFRAGDGWAPDVETTFWGQLEDNIFPDELPEEANV